MASSRVGLVTDSTAYLTGPLVDDGEVCVVPLHVVIGGRSYREGVDVTSEEVARALRSWTPVSTSRPSPATLLEAYDRLAGQDCTEIVSVHISADMSGTHEAARLAARDAAVPVHVVDSRSLGMGLGYAVHAAAQAVQAGADGAAAATAALTRSVATAGFFYVDTLEHLRRGGRISAAQAVLGSALSVKPLLRLVDGRIEPFEKVRTASRAIARLEEVARAHAADRAVDITVHHLASAERAHQLADRLRDRVPQLRELEVGEVGAVVGAHVGPGMLAVVVAPVHPDPT